MSRNTVLSVVLLVAISLNVGFLVGNTIGASASAQDRGVLPSGKALVAAVNQLREELVTASNGIKTSLNSIQNQVKLLTEAFWVLPPDGSVPDIKLLLWIAQIIEAKL